METYTMSQHFKYKLNLDFHLDEFMKMSSIGKYDMPIVHRTIVSKTEIIGISFKDRKNADHYSPTWIYPFVDDKNFQCVWNKPERYVDTFSNFGYVTPADFSILVGMPEAMKIRNVFRNRFLERYYQDKGINVIPNVSWSSETSYDYCFDGLPTNSAIAINCTGIIGNKKSIKLWIAGYERAIKVLSPTIIFRYGDKVEGEDEQRSIYFSNNNLKRLRNGR